MAQSRALLAKGLDEPIEICEVREAGWEALSPPTSSEKAQRQVRADEEQVLGWRPAVGQVVPNTKWVLERMLGEGGFGEVWLGRHQAMKERRVFKFCFRADHAADLRTLRFIQTLGSVFDIVSARDGTLWLRTREGLSRFDGRSSSGQTVGPAGKVLEITGGRIEAVGSCLGAEPKAACLVGAHALKWLLYSHSSPAIVATSDILSLSFFDLGSTIG